MFTSIVLLTALLLPADESIEADVLIKGATLYDGSGQAGVVGDLAIRGERIVGVGKFEVKGRRASSMERGSSLHQVSSTCTRIATCRSRRTRHATI